MRPSLPSPISSYMTSSLCRAEVPQAVLLTICSWSPVSHVISVHITKTLFMSHSKVHLSHSYLYVFLPLVSKLTIVSRTLFLDFFCSQPHVFFVCISFIPTQNLCFLNLTISLRFLWFFTVTSFSNSHLTLTALFFFSISICHVCVSVPILFLSSIHSQRKPYTKTTEFSSTPAFLLQSGCIMLFCDVWGQSSFEVL